MSACGRMDIFNETELRLKFLQARDTYLQADIPNESDIVFTAGYFVCTLDCHSAGRIGADFHPLLVSAFQSSVLQRFTIATKSTMQEFCENMKKFTLISPRSYGSGLPFAGVSSKHGTTLSPPQSINGFLPIVSINQSYYSRTE